MNLQIGKTIALGLGSLCACLAQPGWAQDRARDEDTLARAFQTEDDVREQIEALVGDTAALKKKPHTGVHSGEADIVRIVLRRESVGRRSDRYYGPVRMLRRLAFAEASYDLELEPELTLSPGVMLGEIASRERSGALLTRRTHARQASLFLRADPSGYGSYTISLFDHGGWKPGHVPDMANRIANHEDRARAGVLLCAEYRLANEVLGQSRKLGLEVERSRTPKFSSELVARITIGERF